MKHLIPFFLSLAFLYLSICRVSAQIYVGPRGNVYDDPASGIYVSPNGDDATATGTINAPYKSINAALTAAEPGATVILCEGTYHEGTSVRIRKPNITLKSKKGEWAVIELPFTDDPNDGNCGVFFNPEASNCKLQCVEVIGGFYAVGMDTKWGWHGDDDWMAASNIIIEDCKLHDSRYDVVKVKPNCKNITIRYNEIYNSGKAFTPPFIGEDNAEGIDNVNGDSMLVHNNYIHDICTNGIYAKGGATDVVIENNLIKQTYGAGIMAGFDTSPEFFDTVVNPEYYENIGGIIRNNLIINAGWEGIGLYASKDAQIYNNTLVNVMNINQIPHSAIYFGLSYQDWDADARRPATVNPNIHHNIVCQPAAFNRQMIEIRYANDLGGMSALDGKPNMSNNCYYVAGNSAGFTDNRPGSLLKNAVLPEWKLHIDGDNGSLEIDPALNNDYMPTNPQCTGMGITSPFIINNPTTGIEELRVTSYELRVYPNPTNGELTITNYELRITNVEIYDVMGKKQKAESRKEEGTMIINVSTLSSGIYFLKANNKTAKFIKN